MRWGKDGYLFCHLSLIINCLSYFKNLSSKEFFLLIKNIFNFLLIYQSYLGLDYKINWLKQKQSTFLTEVRVAYEKILYLDTLQDFPVQVMGEKLRLRRLKASKINNIVLLP